MDKPLLPNIGVIAQVHDTWGDRWQARHQIVSRLARYFRVVWMNPALTWRESLATPAPNLRRDRSSDLGFDIYTPEPWLPALYRPRWLSETIFREHLKRARRILIRRGCERIILASWRARFDNGWSDVPFDLRCYHVDDEYSFSPVETPIGPDEMRMLREADQIFVTSRSLLDKKGGINANTALVPNGVDYLAFATPQEEPPDLAGIPHPRIGYAGFLKEQLDWSLLLELATRRPGWSLVFVGPVSPRLAPVAQVGALRRLPNVYFLGAKPTHAVPAYTQNFDVCVMPYRRDDYTKYIYPLKLHEYLATGRPTVGTRIRSLEEFENVLRLACTADDWTQALEKALEPSANSEGCRAERQQIAKRHDWDIQVWTIARTLLTRVAPNLAEDLPMLKGSPALSPILPGRQPLRQEPLTPSLHVSDRGEAAAKAAVAPLTTEATPLRPPQGASAGIGTVLLVSPWYRPAVGGVVEVAERLHRTLNASGVETHLLIAHDGHGGIKADKSTPRLWRMSSASAAFHRLTVKNILATTLRGSLAYWRLHRFVNRHRIKTIIILYPIGYAWLFVLLRRLTPVRLIASLHGNDVTKSEAYEAPALWLLRRVLQTSDAVATCAEHLSAKAQELCPGKKLDIELIPNCVDTQLFAPPPPGFIRKHLEPTFVHVSNFAPKKRTIDIVDAFADSRIPANARLVMVGDGPAKEQTIARATKLGVADRITFVGSQKDVRAFLWEADVFVLASDDEGAPLALLEAMACGLPYVSTPWGPAAMLPPGECGLVVPPHSPELLGAAMGSLITNLQNCREMGLRARFRAENDFKEDKYVERHLDLIRRIEQNTGGPGEPLLRVASAEQFPQ